MPPDCDAHPKECGNEREKETEKYEATASARIYGRKHVPKPLHFSPRRIFKWSSDVRRPKSTRRASGMSTVRCARLASTK
jgi:hypothetical protein